MQVNKNPREGSKIVGSYVRHIQNLITHVEIEISGSDNNRERAVPRY